MAKVFIGTSGWVYEDWRERFYPIDTKPDQRLEYYSKSFNTVELNASFYHLPRKKTFGNWFKKTPVSFAFSVKLSKYITHNLKLKSAKESLQLFLNEANGLGNKLSVVLVQLPPNLKKDTERLENFLEMTRSLSVKTRWAFEFRHETWLSEEVFELLKQFRVAWVIQDSGGRWPTAEIVTGDFVYVRFHGPSDLYSSDYSDKALREWVEKIKEWLGQELNVYVYFNNDINAYAVRNAQTLRRLIKV